jgi:hypothetical protein
VELAAGKAILADPVVHSTEVMGNEDAPVLLVELK